MTVENAKSFLDDLQKDGHSPELMAKIGKDFNSDHMHEALKSRNCTKDELLAHVSGGSKTTDWVEAGSSVVGAAAAAA